MGSHPVNSNEEYAPDPHENAPQIGNRIHSNPRTGARRATEEDEPHSMPPTPLFERLVTEEVQELKAYARIIENQNRRLAELERVHGDLESRLQIEARTRQQLEATLEAREREWAKQLEQLESDRNHWRGLVQAEETKNTRLMEEVMRKEQEIRRMLQRKVRKNVWVLINFLSQHLTFLLFCDVQYDNEGGRSVRGMRGTSHSDKGEASRSPEMHRADFQSPHDILKASGSAEKARLRNTRGLLLDFFGM